MPAKQPTQKDVNLTNLRSSNLPITLPNYKALCELLGESALNGKAKKLQIANWERFFAFEKVQGSNKYIITDIYEEAKPIEPPKYNQRYLDDLVLILLTYCACEQGKDALGATSLYFTKTQLLIILGLCNEDYSYYRNDVDALYKEISGEPEKESTGKFHINIKKISSPLLDEINSFYVESGRKYSGYLGRVNDAVQNRKLLVVEDTFQVREINGRWKDDISIEQKALITKVYEATLLEFRCKSVGAVFHMGAGEAFYQKVNPQLMRLGYDRHRMVTKYSFAPGLDETIELYRSLLKITEAKQAKLNVNANLRKSMSKDELEFRGKLIKLLITLDESTLDDDFIPL